jgi:UDP-N-acetylmuramate--alanine ligase
MGVHPGMRRRTRRIHFVGIGGIGMSGIAEVLLNLGYEVSGSDLKESDTTRRLAGLGGLLRLGHAAEHVVGADVVVVSTAVKADNPELVAAREQKIPVIRRAEMLAELMRLKFGIAIGGTHGKTTTTSLVAAVLGQAGLDPTIVVGGKLNKIGSNAKLGLGDYLVAEADESDGSFHHLSPTVVVVTNIDAEHLDFYTGGIEQIRDTFVDFVNRIPFYGLAVLCADAEGVQAILPRVHKRAVTYGLSPQADYQARALEFDGPRTRFEVWRRGERLGQCALSMLGEHNVRNALAAFAVADELGVQPAVALEALEGFDGVQRRFTVRGEAGGVTVVDDYGHHPEEIRVTLDGARRAYPSRRLVVAFQPHRYTRTRDFMDAFAGAFHEAETLIVSEVYAAGEAPIEGADTAHLVAAITGRGHRDVRAVPSVDAAATALEAVVRPGDLVITFGAGDIWRAGVGLLERLAARAEAGEA